jgi:hypothetical protein
VVAFTRALVARGRAMIWWMPLAMGGTGLFIRSGCGPG